MECSLSGDARARVEHVAEPVAEQIEADHRDHDGEAGKDRDVRSHPEEIARLAQHRPPLRGGRLSPQAEEAQVGGGEDGRGEEERRLHEERREAVRHHVAPEHAAFPRPGSPRGQHVVESLHLRHAAAGEAGGGGMAMAIRALRRPGPKMVITMMARRMVGKETRMSTRRMVTRSSHPPAKPAARPMGTPPRRASPTDTPPMIREMRAPNITWDNTSRPRLSVPKGGTHDGGCRFSPRRMAAGSYGAS